MKKEAQYAPTQIGAALMGGISKADWLGLRVVVGLRLRWLEPPTGESALRGQAQTTAASTAALTARRSYQHARDVGPRSLNPFAHSDQAQRPGACLAQSESS